MALGQKRIPTLVGIGILVLSLAVGVIFLNTGLGVFAPRATPQTTPKNVKITNVKDGTFSVSFLTDESTVGFVKYGTEADGLKLQAGDDRDQLAGTVTPHTTHYITVRDLTPNTTYFFHLGTGSNSSYDNNGTPYTVKTTSRSGSPSAAKTVYGTVNNAQNSPAIGAIVYANMSGVGELSSLVKDSGNWAIPLSSARTLDGSNYASIQDSDDMTLTVQGVEVNSVTTLKVKVKDAQPVSPIALTGGTSSVVAASSAPAALVTTPSATPNLVTLPFGVSPSPTTVTSPSASTSGTPLSQTTSFLPPTQSDKVVDVKADTKQTVDTAQPIITGLAPANVKVTIKVHSTQQITTTATADSTGSYSIDLAELQKTLEPGQHTVTISYTDPQTKKLVTETKTFTVAPRDSASPAPSSNLIAFASPSPTPTDGSTLQPYGSSNPFAIPSSTPVATTQPRVSLPASGSAMPKSGSTETTFLVVGSGLFFLIAGGWSFFATRKHLASIETVEEM